MRVIGFLVHNCKVFPFINKNIIIFRVLVVSIVCSNCKTHCLNLISLLSSRYLNCHEMLLPSLRDRMQMYCYSGILIFRASKGNQQFLRKIGDFEKSGIKLQCLTKERETTFGSSVRELRKNEGSRNLDSTVFYLIGSTPIFPLGILHHFSL